MFLQKKKSLRLYMLAAICCLAVLVGLFSFQGGLFKSSVLETSTSSGGIFENLGKMDFASNFSIRKGGLWDKDANGNLLLYVVLGAKPSGKFAAINMTKREVLFEQVLTKEKSESGVYEAGGSGSWKITKVNGKIYVATHEPATLREYNPATKEFKTLVTASKIKQLTGHNYDNNYLFDFATDGNKFYLGITKEGKPSASLLEYNLSTGEIYSFGELAPGCKNTRSTIIMGDYVYVGYGGGDGTCPLTVKAIHRQTRAISTLSLPPTISENQKLTYPDSFAVLDGKLLMNVGNYYSYLYDPATQIWSTTIMSCTNKSGKVVTSCNMRETAYRTPGSIYFDGSNGALYEYYKTSDGKPYIHRLNSYDNNESFGFAANYVDETANTVISLTSGGLVVTSTLTSLVNTDERELSQIIPIGLESLPYALAVHNNVRAASLKSVQFKNYITEAWSSIGTNALEPKKMEFVDGDLYAATYPDGNLWKYAKEGIASGSLTPLTGTGNKFYDINADVMPLAIDSSDVRGSCSFAGENGIEKLAQLRPLSMAGQNGKIVIGFEPGYSQRGGSLVYVDTRTGLTFKKCNIVPGHNISAVSFDKNDDSIVYIGTSNQGGTNIITPLDEDPHLVKLRILPAQKDVEIIYDKVIPTERKTGQAGEIRYLRIDRNDQVYFQLRTPLKFVIMNGKTGEITSTKNTIVSSMVIDKYDTLYGLIKDQNCFAIFDKSKQDFNCLNSNFPNQDTTGGSEMALDSATNAIYFLNKEVWRFIPAEPKTETGSGTVIENSNTSQANMNAGSQNTNVIQDQNVNQNATPAVNQNTSSLPTNTNVQVLANQNQNQPSLNTNIIVQQNVNVPIKVAAPIYSGGGSSGGGGNIIVPPVVTNTNTAGTVRPSAPEQSIFRDVKGNFAEVYITLLANRGILQGRMPGVFDPAGTLNRAEAAKIIVKAFVNEVDEQQYIRNFKQIHPAYTYTYFSDVPLSVWYAGFVGIAKEASIISGKTSTVFAPSDTVSRAEFLKMALEAKKSDVNTIAGKFSQNNFGYFMDVPSNAWFKNYVYAAAEMGIVQPKANFYPNTPLTRDEAAKITAMLMDA